MAVLGHIGRAQVPALRQVDRADLLHITLDPPHRPRKAGVLAGLLEVAANQQARHVAHVRGPRAQRVAVAERDLVRPPTRVLPRQRRDGARVEKDNVVAQRRERSPLPRAKPLAQADQQQQRRHTPGDAEHRQKRAKFVGRDGLKDLREDVDQTAHRSWLSAAGRNSPGERYESTFSEVPSARRPSRSARRSPAEAPPARSA